MPKKQWICNPPKPPKVKISEIAKMEIKEKCDRFIEDKLKPKYVKPFDKKNRKESQIVDIYCKWYGSTILFIASFKDMRPNVIAFEYEDKFARIKCLDKNHFRVCYMKHTGQWCDVTCMCGDSLNKCLRGIEELPHFMLF